MEAWSSFLFRCMKMVACLEFGCILLRIEFVWSRAYTTGVEGENGWIGKFATYGVDGGGGMVNRLTEQMECHCSRVLITDSTRVEKNLVE